VRDFFQTVVGRWPAGEEHYHWHVLPDPNQMREQVCDPFQELTHRDGLVPVQPKWAHMTVQHGGSLDAAAVTALSEPEMMRIADRVRERCAEISPFEIVVDRPRVGSDRSVGYGARPWGPLVRSPVTACRSRHRSTGRTSRSPTQWMSWMPARCAGGCPTATGRRSGSRSPGSLWSPSPMTAVRLPGVTSLTSRWAGRGSRHRPPRGRPLPPRVGRAATNHGTRERR
jgi:hypothetical protein